VVLFLCVCVCNLFRWFFVWSFVALFVSCVCVCDLFLFSQPPILACSSDSRFRRKLTGTTKIVFWERRDRRCCVWQHGSGSVFLQSLWLKRELELQAFSCVLTTGVRAADEWRLCFSSYRVRGVNPKE